MLRRVTEIACIAFIILWLIPKFFFVRIEPYQIGVRHSLSAGIDNRDFGIGYQFKIPFLHTYYRLPKTLQYLHYSTNPDIDSYDALEVRTSGNNVIFVDITVPWRIRDNGGWKIIREGFIDSYPQKVRSTTTGILREQLASLTNLEIQSTDKRQETAASMLPKLNEALKQYHVEAKHIVIRAIRFRPEYEKKLQNKQFYVVQGRLDEARRKESVALQKTETLEKTIDKETALRREEWNQKIEELKTKYELEIAAIEAEGVRYDRRRRSEGDAFFAKAKAEGDLAEAKAEALGEKLKAQALASDAGKTYSAIRAAENFQMGSIQLNSNDPRFLQVFGSMSAWREFFLGE